MKAKTLAAKAGVNSDGEGLVSHASAFLLSELADRIGLTKALSEALAPTRQRRSAHDPGVVLRDLAVAVTDLGVLAGQDDLFGSVASESTAHRVIGSTGAEQLDAIRAARAQARSRAWDAGARPSELIIDFDATLIGAHSEKHSAAGNYKGGFGFHPLLGYLDGGEPLAALLRPATPARIPPPITSASLRRRSSRSPTPTSTARSRLAPTPAARPTPSPMTAARRRSASRSATSSARRCARRSSSSTNRPGRRRPRPMAARVRVPGWRS